MNISKDSATTCYKLKIIDLVTWVIVLLGSEHSQIFG